MASPYYVDENAVAGGDDGTSWADAFLTFAQALAAATTNGDFIYVAHNHDEALAADTTYTFGANVIVLCRNTGTNAVTTGAKIGSQATNYNIIFAGAKNVYIYGLEFMNGTNTNTGKSVSFAGTDGYHYEVENCKITIAGSSSSTAALSGTGSSTNNGYNKFKDVTIKFGNAGHTCTTGYGFVELVNVAIDSGGTTPNYTLNPNQNGCRVVANGCSFIANTALVKNGAGTGTAGLVFSNCKVPSTIYEAAGTVVNKGQTSVWVYNCASADTHYNFAHYDPLGQTESVVTYCLTGGASYNGTNPVSWRITTTANCSFWTPYVSPWIDKYCGDTGTSITPSLEVLRVGSTTAYLDTEIWGEFSIQDSDNTTQAVLYNDRYSVSGSTALPIQTTSGANQADGVGYASWNAGSSAAADTDDSIKLAVAAVTPNEIGHIRARVVVAAASKSDIYVDPYIYLT